MVTHMKPASVHTVKTTVDLAPELIEQVKQRASEEDTTFRAVLESALWQALKRPARKRRRKMKDCSVAGKPVEGFDLTNWDQVRALIYESDGT